MLTQPYHDPTGDEMEFKYSCCLADKVELEPERLRKPLETIDQNFPPGSAERLVGFMPMDDKLLVKSHHTLRAVVAAAKEQGYSIECPEMPWKPENP